MDSRKLVGDALSDHMVAEALLTAHYIAAAVGAGLGRATISEALALVADRSAITEIWVTDMNGRVEFSSVTGLDFRFPTDVTAASQAAPFAALLHGRQDVVVQGFREREVDGALYKYVGVAGIDKPRIVQVGVAANDSG